MARKVGELEQAVLAVYQQIDAAIPAMHKQTAPKADPSAPVSPWVSVHRSACGLLLATSELGAHCRRAAGRKDTGAIEDALGDDTLARIRAQCGNRGTADADRLHDAARAVEGRLPGHAHIRDEIEWVASNLHRDDPDVAKAPSIAAIYMLVDLKADNALRRDFWNLNWSKRLSPGERKPRHTALEDEDQSGEDEQVDIAALRRRLGMLPDDACPFQGKPEPRRNGS